MRRVQFRIRFWIILILDVMALAVESNIFLSVTACFMGTFFVLLIRPMDDLFKFSGDNVENVEKINLDELYQKTGMSSSKIASAMLGLEMQGIIKVLPGKMISLV